MSLNTVTTRQRVLKLIVYKKAISMNQLRLQYGCMLLFFHSFITMGAEEDFIQYFTAKDSL